MKWRSLLFGFVAAACGLFSPTQVAAADRPKILFRIGDDWGWPHVGSYGDPVVRTPTFLDAAPCIGGVPKFTGLDTKPKGQRKK